MLQVQTMTPKTHEGSSFLFPRGWKTTQACKMRIVFRKNWVPFLLKRISWHSLGLIHLTQKKQRKNITWIEITSLWRLNAFRRTWIPNQLGKELPYISSICLLSKWPNGRVSHFSSSPDQFSKRRMSHEKNPFTFHYTGCLIGILMILIMTHHNPHITE